MQIASLLSQEKKYKIFTSDLVTQQELVPRRSTLLSSHQTGTLTERQMQTTNSLFETDYIARSMGVTSKPVGPKLLGHLKNPTLSLLESRFEAVLYYRKCNVVAVRTHTTISC